MKVAVVGGGVAGVVSSYILQREHQVTLFEKNDYVGGHTNTITIPSGADKGLAVDTGFIVLNDKTYPNFHRFLTQLGVAVRNSDMSFGYYSEETGLQYAGTTLNGLFAQRANLLRLSFWRMLSEIIRFCNLSQNRLEENSLANETLGDFLTRENFSAEMVEHYLLPMAAAIWSAPKDEIYGFPLRTFVTFFKNHGLLSLKDRPQWQTVVGGSRSYVDAFLRSFQGRVLTNQPISTIRRRDNGVEIETLQGDILAFDRVVIATHADEALALLEEPTADEKRLLGAWKYQVNHTVLHTDATILPPNKRAWASWNYRREAQADDSAPVSVTYHMNRLQGFSSKSDYCVTLNSKRSIASDKIVYETNYTHPVYSLEATNTQEELPKLNGVRNTYFCGSYQRYGFHEDAVFSAVRVAEAFGMQL